MTQIESAAGTSQGSASEKPAYLVAENHIIDPEAFKEYASAVLATLVPFGGRLIVRAGATETLEGTPPGRMVIVEFENMEKARSWWDSEAYRRILPLRLKAATGRVFFAEGVAPSGN